MKIRPFLRFPGFRYKALTLSYDDCFIYDIRLKKILDAYNIKCTFNVPSDWLLDCDKPKRKLMTKQEALDLYSDGKCEVACHGSRHLPLAEMPFEMGTQDIISNRLTLEKMFGGLVKGCAYARGSVNERAVEILRCCGIEYARTIDNTGNFDLPEDWLRWNPTCHHDDPRLMELAEQFAKPYNTKQYVWNKRPELFYLWGHSYEFNDENNWEVMENFCKAVCNRDYIWYATNGEIATYVKAYDALRFSADGNTVQNPTCTDVYVSCFENDYFIPAGKTVVLKV